MANLIKQILLETSNIGNKKIKNPETGREIKLSSALGYDKSSAVYKKAASLLKDKQPIVSKKPVSNYSVEKAKDKIIPALKSAVNRAPDDEIDDIITINNRDVYFGTNNGEGYIKIKDITPEQLEELDEKYPSQVDKQGNFYPTTTEELDDYLSILGK